MDKFQDLKIRISHTASSNLKTIIFLIVLVIFCSFVVMNWVFIDSLKNQYREVTDKEARLYAVAISENLHTSELNWVFSEILRKTKFPIIITDKYNTPINWKNVHGHFLGFSSKEISETSSFHELLREDQDILKKLVKKFDNNNPPLRLANEGNMLGYFHYGDTPLINFLAWLPLLEFVILCMIFFMGFIGYQLINQGERNIIWVALAKETAHQMGTPLSSIMGWMEFFKDKMKQSPGNEKNLEIIKEMESDIARLSKVSNRFSQIGSLPKLKLDSINDLVRFTLDYFSHRLPQLGKKIDLKMKLADVPNIYMNRELLGWVLENLIKNSLDSIQNNLGIIQLETSHAKQQNKLHLTITDNGRGIERENWKRIFQTGYSTKKRGWGLGLSLARRIITIYHNGTIAVDWSDNNIGTKIRIILPVKSDKAEKKPDVQR